MAIIVRPIWTGVSGGVSVPLRAVLKKTRRSGKGAL